MKLKEPAVRGRGKDRAGRCDGGTRALHATWSPWRAFRAGVQDWAESVCVGVCGVRDRLRRANTRTRSGPSNCAGSLPGAPDFPQSSCHTCCERERGCCRLRSRRDTVPWPRHLSTPADGERGCFDVPVHAPWRPTDTHTLARRPHPQRAWNELRRRCARSLP